MIGRSVGVEDRLDVDLCLSVKQRVQLCETRSGLDVIHVHPVQESYMTP